MTEPLGPISDTEFEVLKVLWQHGPGTVRELHDKLRRWAYTTVQTLLTRLEKKGYVACDRSGFAHVFRPVVSRDKLLRRRLSELAEQLSDGVVTPLVLALVEDHRFSPEEIEQFRQLLDRLETEPQAGPEYEKRPTRARRKRGRPGRS